MVVTELSRGERVDICRRIVLERGNKRLTLGINTRTGAANETIINIKGKPSVPGSMTQVHRDARDLMQATADELGIPIRYEFSTFNFLGKKLALWALDPQKGAGVFEWDKVLPNNQGHLFTALKTFYPTGPQNK